MTRRDLHGPWRLLSERVGDWSICAAERLELDGAVRWDCYALHVPSDTRVPPGPSRFVTPDREMARLRDVIGAGVARAARDEIGAAS